jgi:hypothetical protein
MGMTENRKIAEEKINGDVVITYQLADRVKLCMRCVAPPPLPHPFKLLRIQE